MRPTKEVSVIAWIEDAEQKVLLVRQALGLRLWTLPGGKVKRGESLVKALRRELYEETGLRAQIGSLLGVLDRRELLKYDGIRIPGKDIFFLPKKDRALFNFEAVERVKQPSVGSTWHQEIRSGFLELLLKQG
jgi:8-oxo-dGTP pyrophosphatase MutT (NUDIX family)